MELEYLQNYWWLLIAVLGALLVFLLFVQGGQTMLFQRLAETERTMIIGCSIRGRVFRLVPAILFHKLRRSLLALDAHTLQLRASGRQL